MLAYRGFRVLQWAMERVPRRWAYALAIVVARLAWVFSRQARARLEFNLGVALPDADTRSVRRIAWQNFRNHSKAYADLMQLPRAAVADLKPLLKVRNQHFVAEGWEPIWAEPTKDREADLRALTERLVRHLELIIRLHPEQWHMPHRIWEGSP